MAADPRLFPDVLAYARELWAAGRMPDAGKLPCSVLMDAFLKEKRPAYDATVTLTRFNKAVQAACPSWEKKTTRLDGSTPLCWIFNSTTSCPDDLRAALLEKRRAEAAAAAAAAAEKEAARAAAAAARAAAAATEEDAESDEEQAPAVVLDSSLFKQPPRVPPSLRAAPGDRTPSPTRKARFHRPFRLPPGAPWDVWVPVYISRELQDLTETDKPCIRFQTVGGACPHNAVAESAEHELCAFHWRYPRM